MELPNFQTEEDTLRFLSPEEKECLQFFEETIDSLENSLEEEDLRPGLNKSLTSRSLLVNVMDGPAATSDLDTVGPQQTTRRFSAKDLDIIDLVRPDPHLMLAKAPAFIPTSPDFQKMVVNPNSHFEIKPRHDPPDNSGPLSGSYQPADSPSYQPVSSVPAPILIVKKIAENHAADTSSNHFASLHRRRSQEGERPLDSLTKQGPPTSAKPSRYPANISLILGKDLQNQSMTNVNLHDRRAQMLANLTGAPEQEDPKSNVEQIVQNFPTRRISFRDPTPEKSRLEALSKLGLTRNGAMSGGVSVLDSPSSNSQNPVASAETSTSVIPMQPSVLPTESNHPVPEPRTTTPPIQTHVSRRTENLPFDPPRTFDYRKPPLSPPPLEIQPPSPPPPEVQLNNFGGKSIVVTPVPPKNEAVSPPASHEAKVLPTALANPSEFNSYGGKSKVLTPAPGGMTKSDLPDILSSHINVNHSLPAKSESLPAELNSYGGKSRTINPSPGLQPPSESPTRSFKGPPPATAPRNPLHSYRNVGTATATRAPSPSDHVRRSGAVFRPQGITVQFSGRGATEESRKEALKKLGLLKDS
ncbi:proline and serine-rich protein 2 isoform X2 [Dunckerocampus dactyliophorus]|uniref:proline and serine-rich protein 2 isoform X2 n=1 Tax=Dunckerocampus dactyliophorus TaxID=161453 RepID=UPI002404A473|nr:proline and serine-rich protein 2 isoform X2 [Dunckerocampus dactyliophorus]